jgi:hypothetical protein
MKSDYKQKSLDAFTKSLNLDLEPRLDFKKPVTGELTKNLLAFCQDEIEPFLLNTFGNGYWGLECLNIGPQTFLMLQHIGIDCELVYGEVSVSGTGEFDTTLPGLLGELDKPNEGGFAIHVWVQVGKDFIIDPTVAARINKYYSNDYPPHNVIAGTSKKLLKELKLDYQPMLMGAKYLTKTCGIPLNYNPKAT